jgi:hypothetical protein
MFILYALVVGIVLGFVLRGRAEGLAQLQFRWPMVLVAGLLVQVALFSDPVTKVVGSLGPPIYVASTAAVFAAVLRNAATPGMPVLALGAACNLAAIVANGGFMPAGADAMAALGKTDPEVYSNSAVVAHPNLELLTDIFALPAWLPFSNIFSIGDVLIAIGVAWVVVAAMRARPATGSLEGGPSASSAPGSATLPAPGSATLPAPDSTASVARSS